VLSGPNYVHGFHFIGVRTSISDTFYRAGAHWRSHAPDSDSEQQQWDMETYNHWLGMIETERHHPDQKLLSGLAVSQNYALPLLVLLNSSLPTIYYALLISN
jgi:hypothetical protein